MVALASAIIAGASLAYGVYSGEQQAKAAKKGLNLQQQAEKDAENSAIRDARLSEEAENDAKKKGPDLGVLLGDQATPKPSPTSVDLDRLLLGRSGALGY